MKRISIFLAVLLLPAGAVFAKAPSLDEIPSVKKIIEDSEKEAERRRLAAEEAKKDPKMEAITAYAKGPTSFYAWKEITEILRDKKEEDRYRKAASDAIRECFRDKDKTDRRVRDVMMEIGRDLVYKLNDSGDREGRLYVYLIFSDFWEARAKLIGYDPNETNYNKRSKAWREWYLYLKKR
jgi:hypothetical protein